MTCDGFINYCASLTATTYVSQWGGAHVWKIDGKVFAINDSDKPETPAFTFKTSAVDFFLCRRRPDFARRVI